MAGATLAGIGFTISLFIADLAFADEHLQRAGDDRHPGRLSGRSGRRGGPPAAVLGERFSLCSPEHRGATVAAAAALARPRRPARRAEDAVPDLPIARRRAATSTRPDVQLAVDDRRSGCRRRPLSSPAAKSASTLSAERLRGLPHHQARRRARVRRRTPERRVVEPFLPARTAARASARRRPAPRPPRRPAQPSARADGRRRIGKLRNTSRTCPSESSTRCRSTGAAAAQYGHS